MTTNKPFKICPLCEEDSIFYHEESGTHLYICDTCPFISLEYIDPKDLINLTNYINRI